jgi:elongation factor 1 alpha-like protein
LDNVLTGLAVSAYPAPPSTAHFSAADFFRDCPWLNIPSHRKADILIEPLYPRLGLLGGAPEQGAKLSKLAALAAARKKKEAEKGQSTPETSNPSSSESEQVKTSSSDQQSAPLSLRDRLARGRSTAKSSEGRPGSLQRLAKSSPSSSSARSNPPAPEIKQQSAREMPGSAQMKLGPTEALDPRHQVSNLRAEPSDFAKVLTGPATGPTATHPSPLAPDSLDLMKIYGYEDAEPFDFAGPSPDDIVLNAQSTAKGLAIRRKH